MVEQDDGMAPPFGSVAWAKATGGLLSGREQVRMFGRTWGRAVPRAVVQRVVAEWWRRRPSQGTVAFDWTRTPSGPLAQLALQDCRDGLSPAMLNHSFRTWVFGGALAEIDGAELHPDLFFAASLLHDLGLGSPRYKRCFTLTGAETLIRLGSRVGMNTTEVQEAADGITHHITPALTLAEGGPIGYYLQAGSLLDLSGVRIGDLPRDFVRRITVDVWPMLDIQRDVGARWRAESAMVQCGRACFLQRWTRFGSLPRTAPLPP